MNSKHAQLRLHQPFPGSWEQLVAALFHPRKPGSGASRFARPADELVVLTCQKRNNDLGMISVKLGFIQMCLTQPRNFALATVKSFRTQG